MDLDNKTCKLTNTYRGNYIYYTLAGVYMHQIMLVWATPRCKSVSATICAVLWVYTSRGLRDAWVCARAAGAAFISSLPYNRCHRDDGVEADCCCERAAASWRCRHPTVDSRWELKSLFACFCWFCLASYVPERPSPLFHRFTVWQRWITLPLAVLWRCMWLVQHCY